MAACFKKIIGYTLDEKPSKNVKEGERTKDIQINFLCDENMTFASSMNYKNVPEEKIQSIRKELDKYTQENAKTPKGVAVCFTFLDMIREVSEIIYNN